MGFAVRMAFPSIARSKDTAFCRREIIYGVILGSGGPGLLYLYKRVCRPPGGRGGAGEGYMGDSDGALSPGGSIWLTSRPVLEVLVRGAGLYEI